GCTRWPWRPCRRIDRRPDSPMFSMDRAASQSRGEIVRLQRLRRLGLLIPCLVLLAGCGLQSAGAEQAAAQKLSTAEDRALAESLIRSVQTGDEAFLAARTPPELGPKVDAAYPGMRKALPSGPDAKLRLVDAGVNGAVQPGKPASRHAYLAYEID